MRLIIGITTLAGRIRKEASRYRNEIKMQQTRKIKIEEIRTRKKV